MVIIVGVCGDAVGHALTVSFNTLADAVPSPALIFDYGQLEHHTNAGFAFEFNVKIGKLLLPNPVVAFPFYNK